MDSVPIVIICSQRCPEHGLRLLKFVSAQIQAAEPDRESELLRGLISNAFFRVERALAESDIISAILVSTSRRYESFGDRSNPSCNACSTSLTHCSIPAASVWL